jgi:phospholipid-binding lipoprotein MlaA
MKTRAYILLLVLILVCGCTSANKKNAGSESVKIAEPETESAGEFEDGMDVFAILDEELEEQAVEVSDPIEPFNRVMFGFNDVFYFWVAKPVLTFYADVVPEPFRVGTSNFFSNVTMPVRAVNCVLQNKGKQATVELHRFAINTTVGVLGIYDPATEKYELVKSKEDLGQSLGTYGWKDSFYIVWPLLGPKTGRDSLGMFGDSYLNPVSYIEPTGTMIGVKVFQYGNEGSFHLGEYEGFKEMSVDPYIAIRDAYIQYRNSQIEK